MSINSREVMRLEPDQSVFDVYMQSDGVCGYASDLSVYLDGDYSNLQVGSVLLAPTYRLEEVEEVIEPEKPGVLVEPYAGLEWWDEDGDLRRVMAVYNHPKDGAVNVVLGVLVGNCWRLALWSLVEAVEDKRTNYPTTTTPAVTRKVKKWVKIEHPEVPEE